MALRSPGSKGLWPISWPPRRSHALNAAAALPLSCRTPTVQVAGLKRPNPIQETPVKRLDLIIEIAITND